VVTETTIWEIYEIVVQVASEYYYASSAEYPPAMNPDPRFGHETRQV
jgi:hypothetical protein